MRPELATVDRAAQSLEADKNRPSFPRASRARRAELCSDKTPVARARPFQPQIPAPSAHRLNDENEIHPRIHPHAHPASGFGSHNKHPVAWGAVLH